MWFTEDPWPPVLILGVIAVVFGLAWNATRRGKFLLLAVGTVLLALAVFVGEEMYETESERVEDRVLKLAAAVRRSETETVLTFFAADADNLRNQIAGHLGNVKFEDLHISDIRVKLEPGETEAHSDFRANGMATWRETFSSNFATRWNLTWLNEGGTWKVSQIERMDPIKGDVIGTWSGL